MKNSTQLQFMCPWCGSRFFGSYEEKGERIYTCHGQQERGCKFTWKGEDEWRVWVLVTVVRFESAEEYDNVERVERRIKECGQVKSGGNQG